MNSFINLVFFSLMLMLSQNALNEAKLLSILDHPNIISYYDCFEHNGMLQIAMEYADGGTLASLLSSTGELCFINYYK